MQRIGSCVEAIVGAIVGAVVGPGVGVGAIVGASEGHCMKVGIRGWVRRNEIVAF